MFTGIVQGMGRVVDLETAEGICRLTVDLGPHAEGLQAGASVANNGTCLTVSDIDGSRVRFDVIAETMHLTNLGSLSVGNPVNIERSLRFGDELGGHVLSGHVSGTATVCEIIAEGDNRTMWFDVDASLMPYLLWKGWARPRRRQPYRLGGGPRRPPDRGEFDPRDAGADDARPGERRRLGQSRDRPPTPRPSSTRFGICSATLAFRAQVLGSDPVA